MKTFMYSKKFPDGKLFDTLGDGEPLPTKQGQIMDGVAWYDSPYYLKMTTDQVVEAAVMQELAKQGSDRDLLDKEHQKLYGFEPRAVESDKRVEKSLDEPKKRGRPRVVR